MFASFFCFGISGLCFSRVREAQPAQLILDTPSVMDTQGDGRVGLEEGWARRSSSIEGRPRAGPLLEESPESGAEAEASGKLKSR